MCLQTPLCVCDHLQFLQFWSIIDFDGTFFYQALIEKCQCVEETCSRKDKALSQFKMILKFREEALRRIEKSIKEKSSIDSEDKNSLIVS